MTQHKTTSLTSSIFNQVFFVDHIDDGMQPLPSQMMEAANMVKDEMWERER
jgi:hypothetical protein